MSTQVYLKGPSTSIIPIHKAIMKINSFATIANIFKFLFAFEDKRLELRRRGEAETEGHRQTDLLSTSMSNSQD